MMLASDPEHVRFFCDYLTEMDAQFVLSLMEVLPELAATSDI